LAAALGNEAAKDPLTEIGKAIDTALSSPRTSSPSDRAKQTAKNIIAGEKKGSINREFPKEWLNKTYEEISKAAKAGDKSAKKAKKLLDDKRFDKEGTKSKSDQEGKNNADTNNGGSKTEGNEGTNNESNKSSSGGYYI
jgi:hypothetical protein